MRSTFKELPTGFNVNGLEVVSSVPRKIEKNGVVFYQYLIKCSQCGQQKWIRKSTILSNRIKSCGCLWVGNKGKILGEISGYRLYTDYRTRARLANRKFEVTLEQFLFLTSQNCYYCGVEPSQKRRTSHSNKYYLYNGIDRRDNTRGYELDNCVPCCKFCNQAKSTLTEEQFYNWAKKVVERIRV
jgi:hypothetical protein